MNNRLHPAGSITTPEYWNDTWRQMTAPKPIDPHSSAPENHFYRCIHAHLSRWLGISCAQDARLIEIGCGGSRWLPYFNREFGYEVSGIEYTAAGIQLARDVLQQAGIQGTLEQGDLFEPPINWEERFDVVVSFGLVEHFENTAQAISACARYLRPGGTMVTLVPTMRGLYGAAYRMFRPDVYSKHVPQSRESLVKSHLEAGLKILHSSYVLGLPALLTAPMPSSSVAARASFYLSSLYLKLEGIGLGVPPNGFTSPYALCIVTKPDRVGGAKLGDLEVNKFVSSGDA